MVIIHTLTHFDTLSRVGRWSFSVEGRVFSGEECDTSFNRLEILAAINCLGQLVETKEVLILSGSKYLVSGAENFLRTWEAAGWATKGGYPLKNQDLWAKLADLRRAHNKVSFKLFFRPKNIS